MVIFQTVEKILMRRNDYENSVRNNTDRWIVSYADFITLLFGFFVMMYAISSVSDGSYRVLSDSIVEALAKPDMQAKDSELLSSDEDAEIDEKSGFKGESYKENKLDDDLLIKSMANTVKKSLSPWMEMNLIDVVQTPVRLEIEINASVLFDSGSAVLAPDAEPILEVIADILKEFPNGIHIEGFTDNMPISNSVYPSNWELSAFRAASVVRMFRVKGVKPERMAAVGYGEFRPVANNFTQEGRNRNRRIVIVVLPGNDPRDFLEVLASKELLNLNAPVELGVDLNDIPAIDQGQ